MTAYTCARCSAPARVLAGTVAPSCECGAPITAHLRAHARGAGGCDAGGSFLAHIIGRILAAFRRP